MNKLSWVAVLTAVAMLGGAHGALAKSAGGSDAAAVVDANSLFALDLYARLRAADGNLFFSGYSISNALAMTAAGARGATATEMYKTLRLPFAGDRLHTAFGALIRDAGARRRAELSSANALWSHATLPVAGDFQKTIRDAYGGELRSLDFTAPEKARGAIN